jgi:hypothetical protein
MNYSLAMPSRCPSGIHGPVGTYHCSESTEKHTESTIFKVGEGRSFATDSCPFPTVFNATDDDSELGAEELNRLHRQVVVAVELIEKLQLPGIMRRHGRLP